MSKVATIILILIFLGTGNLNARIENEDKPSNGEWNFDLQEVWSVDTAGDNPLVRAGSIKVDDNGDVYMLDRKFGKVVAFNTEGKQILYFGEIGEGPGEFKSPQALYIKGRYIIVSDQGQKLHYFTKKGEYKYSFRRQLGMYPRHYLDISRYVTIRSNPEERKKSEKETLEIHDVKTGKSTVIAELIPETTTEASSGSGKNSIRVTVQIDELTPSVVVGTGRNALYYGRNDTYSIKKTDLKGKELFSFSIEGRKTKPVSMEYKKNLFKRSDHLSPEIKKDLIKGLPDECTYFDKIVEDEKGFIYVYVVDVSNKTGQVFDIFSPEGKYLYHAEITLPDGLRKIGSLILAGEHMFAFVEDEDGERKLVKYKIKTP